MDLEPASEQRRRGLASGHHAERLAVLWLALKGYRILARRFRVSGGEIDIVARRGDTLAFVEVKARATFEAARLAVTPAKIRRVARAAAVWVSRYPSATQLNLRGDLVLVAPYRLPRHIADAFPLWL